MVGLAIAENIFSSNSEHKSVGKKNHSTVQPSVAAISSTSIDTSLQVQQPNKVSVTVQSIPLSVPEKLNIAQSIKQENDPVFNIAPKNSFHEIDRSSQTVHSSLTLTKSSNTLILPEKHIYSGEDSIGADGRVVLDGDEFTVNARPLKRKINQGNTNILQGTYTYYRETTPINNKISSSNTTVTRTIEPIVSFLGTLLNGKANGYGVGVYANGNTYKGNWKDNSKEGYGVYNWRNGEEYRGNYKNDLRNGYGKMYTRLGQLIQEGYWENDQYVK